MNYSLFISCPKGLEYLLEEEVRSLGLKVERVSPQGVYGEANLTVLYNLCLWSRLANRVQLILFSGEAHNEQTLQQLCRNFPWQTVFSVDKTLAIEFHGSSAQIRNTMYGAQLVKDGIVDHFRQLTGQRPSVEKKQPQILIHAYLKQDKLTVSFDLTGYSLHQRGYRTKAGLAPLKENVAAAILMRAKWPQLAAQGYGLQDPFCGSGTLVIEAAMMAAQIAPGLLRQDQSLQYWAQHQESLWEKLRHLALQQVRPFASKLIGSDAEPSVIAMAKSNAEKAGVAALVEFYHTPLAEAKAATEKGLVICNPPYGERLGDLSQLIPLYSQLGQVLHQGFAGWQAAILTQSPVLAKATGLRAQKQYTVFNGALECKLYCLDLVGNELKGPANEMNAGQEMLFNRLKKNYQHLKKWAEKNHISCYRVYDADLPEYAFAIDLYQDYAILQEYKAPAEIAAHKAEKRGLEVMQVVPLALNIGADHLILKQRQAQKGSNQYQRLNQSGKRLEVSEGRARYYVNLWDYLDTGLFLDHRPLRMQFNHLPAGIRFLNCFCYTATASVQAALAGAKTTNVDMSKTYLQWGIDNFKLNDLNLADHRFIQANCLEWLKVCREKYEVIFLDPPSFSNSKRMEGVFDIQRDQLVLIELAMRLLAQEGRLYFSTNLRSFKLDPRLESMYRVKDISAQTVDLDFKRNPKIHRCYLIQEAT